MGQQVVVERCSPCVHQLPEPGLGGRILGLKHLGVDEQFHAEVTPDLRLSFCFSQAALAVQEVDFDAGEVVFRLGVDHAKYGVRVRLAVAVGDAPIVPHDGDAVGSGRPFGHLW